MTEPTSPGARDLPVSIEARARLVQQRTGRPSPAPWSNLEQLGTWIADAEIAVAVNLTEAEAVLLRHLLVLPPQELPDAVRGFKVALDEALDRGEPV